MGGRREYVGEAIEYLVHASSAPEAFGALAGRLLSWLSCQLVVLQVKMDSREPLLLQGGGALTLPGIGVGWRSGESSAASALPEGEIVVHDDLHHAFSFGEDASLVRAGLASAARGALYVGGREVGRFGVFAEQPNHFTPDLVQILRDVAPALGWLCRQVAFTAQFSAETEVSTLLDEVIQAAGKGLRATLQACRARLSRMIPAAGALAVLEAPGDHPEMLLDQVGIAIPGVPETDDPAQWRRWLNDLPAGGRVESVAWIFPIMVDAVVVGALAIAFPQGHENPQLWSRRLRPMLSLLAVLIESEQGRRKTEKAARNQIGALASGLADEIGNLMTALALQVDLLQAHLVDRSEAVQRSEALMRLVEKGTTLSSRLERMAASQRYPELWEPLYVVIERVAQHLRTYQGGQQIVLQSRLGETGDRLVEAGMVEHAVTQLVLSMAQTRTSEVRPVLYGRASASQPSRLTLWCADEREERGWQCAENGDPTGTYWPVLEVPTRMRVQPMEGSGDGKPA